MVSQSRSCGDLKILWYIIKFDTYTPSTTTATPAGCTAFVTAIAICFVSRSCTWSRLLKISTILRTGNSFLKILILRNYREIRKNRGRVHANIISFQIHYTERCLQKLRKKVNGFEIHCCLDSASECHRSCFHYRPFTSLLSGRLTSKRRSRAVTRVKVCTVLGDQSRHILSFRLNISLIKARISATRPNCRP